MKKWNNYWMYLTLGSFLAGCHAAQPAEQEAPANVRTPVTVTSVSETPISNYIQLNATSAFLQKSIVKANANGYVQSVNTQIGSYVKSGQQLFSVQTKESSSIGNSISILDSSFHFTGLNIMKANTVGYITELNHQSGDYVQDGEQLAVISNMNSFVFILNLPYELRPYLPLHKQVELVLPDGVKLKGIVASMMPSVDSVAQTQRVVIKVKADNSIPENLIAKVNILKSFKNNVLSLPKEAILTDESQTSFWVMKLVDSITAVKTEIKKGMSDKDRVEIISPTFSLTDKILLTGNYGLPDTAQVKIMTENP